ncbi:dihydroneopterin aldolase [Kocuria sp. JC486]|uniref:7,8-dihydroneopterin aldolase n=1 Tax=Kocuria soli TaxID=2485125 RepID=A0A3N3ZS85_9MICC|nr:MULTISPECIES: dihydroneopterin aldolase [Kocuria]NHU85626.1 dihydroneopterin aldolase [Kocuria sp. JC486]ROZ62799.1 dihydroneopterin aldolase [Kocuria soli]
MTNDRIALTGIKGFGHHGVLEEEKRNGQPFVVDAVLHLDLAPAARTDELTETVHYGEIAELIHAEIESKPVDLIETLADRTARLILERYPAIQLVELTVNKPQAPITVPFGNVAVTVTRERTP